MTWEHLAWSVGVPVAAAAGGWLLWRIVIGAVGVAVRRRGTPGESRFLDFTRRPTLVLAPLLALLAALPAARLPAAFASAVTHAVGLGLIAAAAWTILSVSRMIDDHLIAHHHADAGDDLTDRGIETRVIVLRRVLTGIVLTMTLAVMLLTFPGGARIGASLLASAGIAGLVAGFAARPVLTNLLAGIQIALTQPMRIEDVVIVEGEWGWIEEICATYVVVRIWDLRRLVLPLTYFIEQPFQNWTRRSADLLGYIHIYVDYSVPIEALRGELHRILQETELWDRKTWSLQATEATERCLQVRCLMSAADSGASWNLRCHVREKMIEFLQREYPGCLPRLRLDVPQEGIAATGGA